ncbi:MULTISPECIES: antibiotic biosynthesis monooxygenase [Modicisalibacter]|uniref:antibiotic biosynthesis monooxygenase n=1 Tax=Modicisalibacter TaxID=574347 RepID=UPI001939DA4D|nr:MULTISPECIES: antibiotic biosynthesis monooxygenase [Halomonadaceae]MBZ9559859.1 antibiotic biosynthesis monooxygenase [Modicisalibacter sp. R2A 31.J]MBZ9577311.1 antibiotic biosynthesis monooxygenase [Modicisalibacter sp. MOD 31.J]
MSTSPVTLMVARRVARGRYRDFNVWLNEGRDLAADFPGYLGSGVLAPPPGDNEYQIVFRFADEATLTAWEHSASRRAWLVRGRDLFEAPQEHRATGLDSWFRHGQGHTPPRWKQAVAIWLAFFPVSLTFQWLFGDALADLPLVPRVLASTLMLTPVMVFVFIPLSTRLLAPWLNAAAGSRRAVAWRRTRRSA